MEREPIRIAGGLVTALIRKALWEGEAEALRVGRQCLDGVTDDQILKIARGEARIVGTSGTSSGIAYVEGKE